MTRHQSPQQELMRHFYRTIGPDKQAVCAAYAKAERDGLVGRIRNVNGLTPEQYASRLWSDVKCRGGFE
jgi:hypothetical protein